MKKILNIFSSMKFGVALLIIIAIFSGFAAITGYESIYSSWYFLVFFILLALNLLFCSIVRVNKIPNWKNDLLERSKNSKDIIKVSDKEQWLKKHSFKKSGSAYIHNGVGLYGTFFVHLSFLLLTISAILIFRLSVYTDYVLPVGDTLTLDDGTSITVNSFSMKNDKEEVEYKSNLSVIMPDGTQINDDVLVNYPIKAGDYKIYQQNYSYSASINIKTDNGEETIQLTEPAFLTLDEENGIYYSSIFSNVKEENGEVLVSHDSEMINPAYEVNIIENGETKPYIVYPNTVYDVAGVTYTFYEPQVNPGLRVKNQAGWTLVLLYMSFAMMIFGLYLNYFCIAEAASINKDGVSIVAKKDNVQRVKLYMNELEINKEGD